MRQLVASGLTAGWTLAGGTALALQLGHRYSEDLDFFRTETFDVDWLITNLARINKVQVQSRTPDTLHVLLDGLRVSFLKAEAPMLYEGATYRGLTLADPRDIAVMKVIAIGGRGSKKDFVDLYCILTGGSNLQDILAMVDRRFNKIDYNHYHLQKSLVWFDDAETEPMPYMIKDIDWNQVKSEIVNVVRAMAS